MPQQFAEKMVADRLISNKPLFDSLAAIVPPPSADSSSITTIPPPPSASSPIFGMPFSTLISIFSPNTILGDINLFPHTYHFSTQPLTPDQVRALPPNEQMWDFGYVLDPVMKGKGVMSEMVGCIIESWVKPYMRLGKVGAVSLIRDS
jgi:hypothetical protein